MLGAVTREWTPSKVPWLTHQALCMGLCDVQNQTETEMYGQGSDRCAMSHAVVEGTWEVAGTLAGKTTPSSSKSSLCAVLTTAAMWLLCAFQTRTRWRFFRVPIAAREFLLTKGCLTIHLRNRIDSLTSIPKIQILLNLTISKMSVALGKPLFHLTHKHCLFCCA